MAIKKAEAGQLEFTRIGIGTHFAQKKGNVESDIKNISKIGFNSLRDELYWQSIEVNRGIFKIPAVLGVYDSVLSSLSHSGLNPLVILSYGNSIYTADGLPTDPSSMAAFANYANYVSSRYRGKVLGYEIWNEWNKSLGSKKRPGEGPVDDYWELVKSTAPVIKKNDKDAEVVVGVVAGRDINWIRKLIRKDNFFDYADAISVHPYNFCDGSRSRPEDVVSWLRNLESVIYSDIGKPIPIYVSEIGWPTHKGKCGTSEQLSAYYLARMILLSGSVSSLKGVYIYDYRDDGLDLYEKEHNFGIVNYFGVDKPAASLLADSIDVLNKYYFEAIYQNGNIFAVTFKSEQSERVVLAWNAGMDKVNVELSIPCNKSDSMKIFNRELGATGQKDILAIYHGGFCKAQMVLSPRPVVITGSGLVRPHSLLAN